MIEIERQVLKKFSGKGFRAPFQTKASLSEIYHENTKLTPISSRAYGSWIGQIARSKMLTTLMSKPFKTYTLMDQVSLPPASPQQELENLIVSRRSIRHYAGTSVSQEELGRLFYFSYGITD